MELTFVRKFMEPMAGWFPLLGVPSLNEEYEEWITPVGQPVKNKRWHTGRPGRGAKADAPQHSVEFHHRGAFSRHELRPARHTPKAFMAFRGKGFKIERRSARSIDRRRDG
jgi:hypothetical protein